MRLDQPTFVRWLIDHSNIYAKSSLYPQIQDSAYHLRQIWFFNPLNAASMRLTKLGYLFCTKNVEIEHYQHHIPQKILPKTLLQMEKYLPCPYYINDLTDLRVFDEHTSIVLSLYNNNLHQYLNNIDQLDK